MMILEFEDIFGRKIEKGDYVLIPASYGKSKLAVLFVKVLEITKDDKRDAKCIKYTIDADELKKEIPDMKVHYIELKKGYNIAFSAIKLTDKDIFYEYNDNNFLYNIYSSKIVNDIAKRELNLGDFVLLFPKSNFKRTSYGIVTAKDTVYTGVAYLKDKICFKIENPTEKEQEVYKTLVSKLQKNMLKVKEELSIGDIFMDNNRDRRYIYIGQFYKYIKEKSNCSRIVYENLSDKCYTYLKFDLTNKNDANFFNLFINSNTTRVTNLIERYLYDSIYNRGNHSLSHLVTYKNPKKFNNYKGKVLLDLNSLLDIDVTIYMKKVSTYLNLQLFHENPLET